jgi:hypothetical protein
MKTFPKGFLWGETVQWTVARPEVRSTEAGSRKFSVENYV